MKQVEFKYANDLQQTEYMGMINFGECGNNYTYALVNVLHGCGKFQWDLCVAVHTDWQHRDDFDKNGEPKDKVIDYIYFDENGMAYNVNDCLVHHQFILNALEDLRVVMSDRMVVREV